jgi:hypothetical protein
VRNDPVQAERFYRETLSRRVRSLGNEHPDTIRVRWQVARSLVDQRRFKEGEEMAREASGWAEKVLPREDENSSSSHLYLGLALLGQGKAAEATAALRDCVGRRAARQTPGWETPYARVARGAAIGGQGQWAEAESLLVGGFEGLEQSATPPARLEDARQRVRDFYRRWEAADPAARAAAPSARWGEPAGS